MDIPRKSQARRCLIRRILYSVIALSALSGAGWYVSRLKPAAPSIDRATVWIDTIKRGPMLRQVRGLGKLVPEEIRWVTSATEGRVEKKLLEAGARVKSDTILIELINAQLEQETLNAEWDWKAEESSYADLKVRLEREQLAQAADIAKFESDHEQAVLRYEANAELQKSGLISKLDLKRDSANSQQLANRLQIEKQRLKINKQSIAAQLAQQRTKIDQRHAIYTLKKSQLDQLNVRAGVDGVLQVIQVDVGQRVAPGANLARIANPNKLKAELNISETQAKDVQIGQEVSIDMRNGVIPGRVSRIDPAVKDGTVTVDVHLEGELPKGARPDLSVDGTIVLEKLDDVVYVGRPVQGQSNSQLSIFKLDPEGKSAARVTVKLGRSSVNTIEIKEGLKPGDQVILSDMTAHDGFDRIRLN
ncbi:MAG: HlyD family efflux transporter periplasmic adaptor subunit [Acidobacteria bacterium]|nr:HlyD family efflux transporter periplasmic adaptor subunit [Acidobacteriota bacterium]